GHFSAPLDLPLEKPLKCRKPLRDAFRIVQSIDPDDERTTAEAFDDPLNEWQSHRFPREICKCRRFDADGEGSNTDRVVCYDEIEIATVQAAFPREIAAEIKSVVASLKSNKIVVAERWDETFVMGQHCQHLGRGTWNVKEKADAIFVPTLAER